MVYRQPDKDELFTEENRRVMDRTECILCNKMRFTRSLVDGICRVCRAENDPDVPEEEWVHSATAGIIVTILGVMLLGALTFTAVTILIAIFT